MKNLEKKLAKIKSKSFQLIKFSFASCLLFFLSCKKNDSNHLSLQTEKAKDFFETNVKPLLSGTDNGFKNLNNAVILWEKSEVLINQNEEDEVSIPIYFKNKFSTAFNNNASQKNEASFILKITTLKNGGKNAELVLKTKISSIEERHLVLNLLTNKEELFYVNNGKRFKKVITKVVNSNFENNSSNELNSNATESEGNCLIWGVFLIEWINGERFETLLYTYQECDEEQNEGGGGGGGGESGNNCAEMVQAYTDEFELLSHTPTGGTISYDIVPSDYTEIVIGNGVKWEVARHYMGMYTINAFLNYNYERTIVFGALAPYYTYNIKNFTVYGSHYSGNHNLFISVWTELGKSNQVINNNTANAKMIGNINGSIRHYSRTALNLATCGISLFLDRETTVSGNTITVNPG
jgi:hypothetical protein